jgi:osmoprotectant transport system ATP-binding protein
VNLEARTGEVLAILGTSGSGKTTLLKLVNRLIDPTSGEVIVGGRPTTAWNPIELRRSMGYVIQEAGLMPHMTIRANVGLVPKLLGTNKLSRHQAADRCLGMVGLNPKLIGERFPHELSGGQRQRVGVARALASDPALILMDEPFGALDPITRREIQDEFRTLQRNLGKTVILVTHDLREACRLADRLALVAHGRLVQYGEPADFLERPADDFVRSFFQDAQAVTPAREGARS